MDTKQFVEEIIKVLEKAKKDNEYTNPHILSEVAGGIQTTGQYEVPYELEKWIQNMWGW